MPLGALAGLRVIDLSRVLGGPFCTQILGDHGADVIKIEPPEGDETRTWGPPFDEGLSAYFAGVNRNKRCMALDLSRTDGREVLFRILESADVLVENFKPGTLEKWGMGYESVLELRFPRLIHCRISGFGEDGPMGSRPGYDAAVQAWSGLMSVNGSAHSGPLRVGIPIVDLAAGLNACIGILAAVHERHRSGRGQSVSTSLFESGLSLLHPHAANYFMSGVEPQLLGSAHPNISPYDLFRTKTVPLFLAVGNNAQFIKLCTRLRATELASDPRFRDNKDRVANREALKAEIEVRLSVEEGERLGEELLELGVPAGPVLGVAKAVSLPQAVALESVKICEGTPHLAPPVHLSRTPPSIRKKADSKAKSHIEVLMSLGWSIDDIQALQRRGVFGPDAIAT